jgi:hypothetical protein
MMGAGVEASPEINWSRAVHRGGVGAPGTSVRVASEHASEWSAVAHGCRCLRGASRRARRPDVRRRAAYLPRQLGSWGCSAGDHPQAGRAASFSNKERRRGRQLHRQSVVSTLAMLDVCRGELLG